MFAGRLFSVLVLVVALVQRCDALHRLAGRREQWWQQQPRPAAVGGVHSLNHVVRRRSLRPADLPDLAAITVDITPEQVTRHLKHCHLCASKCQRCLHCAEAISTCPENRDTASCSACGRCSGCPQTSGKHPTAYESCSCFTACAVCCPHAYFACEACSFCLLCKYCPK